MTRDWSPLAVAYLVLAVAGLIGTWIFNALAIVQMRDFIGDLVTSGPAVSSITVDLLVAAVAGSVFIIVEARRLGMRFGVAVRRGIGRSRRSPSRSRCSSPCGSAGCTAREREGAQAGRRTPVGLEQRSHTSLIVGYAGTACHSRSIGTSPTTAIVAACSSSPTSGPDERRADEHPAVLVDDRPRRARVVVGVRRSRRRPTTRS